MARVSLTVNGVQYTEEVEPRFLLVHLIRDRLGLTGTHVGCDTSSCGACTLQLDGQAVKSCTVLAVQADDCEVMTIEGITDSGEIADLQERFVERNALQCGYCTPGMLMTAAELLEQGAPATRDDIRMFLSGNYCRCTGYHAIVDAVEATLIARLGR